MPYIVWFVLLMLLAEVGSASVTSPVLLDGQAEQVNVAPYLGIFEDPSGQLGIRELATPDYTNQFTPNTQETAYFGYSHSNWWVRFNLAISSQATWYLVLDQPLVGDVELFALPVNGKVMDNTQPLFSRLASYRTPVWRLNLPPGETFSFYLKANNGQSIVRLPLKLMTSDAFVSHSTGDYMFFMLVFAGLWVLVVYNLFLLFFLKEMSYLSLVLFISVMQIQLYRDSNLFPPLVFLNNPNSWFFSASVIVILALAFHYWRFINQNANVALERLLKWLQRGMIVLFPIVGLIPDSPQWINLGLLVLLPVLLVMFTQTVMMGHRLTSSTYLAVLTFVCSMGFYAVARTGWIPEYVDSSTYVGHVGTLFAILLLSINQADRSRLLREQAERAEAASQAKDAFLTTISHELRTPMHAILGIGELLKRMANSSEQRDYLHKLETTSRHMLGVVNDILDLAQLGNDSLLKQEAKPFCLDTLLLELEEMFSVSAAQKNLSLSVHPLTQPCPTLLGDAKRLKQVLVNLLGNAIKYTDEGQVSLRCMLTEVIEKPMMTVCFEVVDTGIGVPVEQQAYLFQPFYQVDNSRARQRGGSGLGLAISHKLVAGLGGKLNFVSTLSEGSRFFFTLMLPIATLEPAPAELVALPSLQGIRILLVDDDEINCLLGKTLLEAKGWNVRVAGSGQEALHQMRQHAFDQVLMDVSMPGMDGYETTRRIRADKHYQHLIPIIGLTAHAIAGERERCLAAGMDDYLSKPFDIDDLVSVVQRFTNR